MLKKLIIVLLGIFESSKKIRSHNVDFFYLFFSIALKIFAFVFFKILNNIGEIILQSFDYYNWSLNTNYVLTHKK